MTTAITKPKSQQVATSPSALKIMASRMAVDADKLYDTLKATVFKGATNEELLALVVVGNAYDLNPLLKELYAFPAKGGGIVPIVSVDGWNKMLIRQPDFDGIEFEFTDDDQGNVYACTATIHIKNRSHPVKITEYFSECVRKTDPWTNMPRRMLRNRTLCQASRMAFGFSGISHEEEVGDVVNVESAVVVTTPPKELPPKVIPTAEGKTPQAELETVVVTAGYTFTDLQKFGVSSGHIEGADSMASFAEVPVDVCRRLLRAKEGMLQLLAKSKEGVAS